MTYLVPEDLDRVVAGWLRELSPWNRTHLRPRPGGSALLVVDMQRYFLEPGAPAFLPASPAILPGTLGLIQAFRRARRPVLWTRHAHDPDGSDAGVLGEWWGGMIREGEPWAEIDPRLAPDPTEPVLRKRRYSAFQGTDLMERLQSLEITDLAICGVMTHLCVETSARHAFMLDLRVHVPADGTATSTVEHHRASLLNLAHGFAVVTTMGRLQEALGQA